MSVNITITSNAKEAVRKLREFPDKLRAAIVTGMNRQNAFAISEIQKNRLRGQFTGKPYPVSEHKLSVRTARLWRSLNYNNPETLSHVAQRQGDVIFAAIGTNVEYAGAHEFGFSGSVFVNSHLRKSHLRKTAGKKRRSRVAEAIVSGHGRTMNIPARAPIKHGLDDYADAYGQGISQAIVKAWNKHVRETGS